MTLGPYIWRALTPAQEEAVAVAMAAGVSPKDLAAEYVVSVRTIYRAAHRGNVAEWHEATVGDYRAQFIVTNAGPVQCTPWQAR